MVSPNKHRDSSKILKKKYTLKIQVKPYKIVVIKILNELERRIDEHSENFNKKEII